MNFHEPMLDDLRAELERELKLLAPADQARVLRVILAMQAGTTISAEALRAMTSSEVREFADRVGRKTG